MTTTESSITKNMTPAEAATLLAKLEEGHQAAWRATRETRRESAERESRFHNAAEVDGVFRDLMWETLSNGTRHPGESVAQFAERAHAEARRADAGNAGTQPAAAPMTQRTGSEVTPGPAAISPDEEPAQLLGGAGTPLGQAYARAFSGTAAARVRELRKQDPLPEPDRTPGALTPTRSWPAAAGTSMATASTPAEPRQRPRRGWGASWRPGHDDRGPCRADPRCEVPAPAETRICHCHTKQASKTRAAVRGPSLAEQVKRAWSREPEKEPEP